MRSLHASHVTQISWIRPAFRLTWLWRDFSLALAMDDPSFYQHKTDKVQNHLGIQGHGNHLQMNPLLELACAWSTNISISFGKDNNRQQKQERFDAHSVTAIHPSLHSKNMHRKLDSKSIVFNPKWIQPNSNTNKIIKPIYDFTLAKVYINDPFYYIFSIYQISNIPKTWNKTSPKTTPPDRHLEQLRPAGSIVMCYCYDWGWRCRLFVGWLTLFLAIPNHHIHRSLEIIHCGNPVVI